MDVTLIIDEVSALLAAYALRVVGVVILIVVAWIAAGWIQTSLRTRLEKTRLDVTLTRFFASAARWIILLSALIAVLGLFGIQTTGFVAVLGAAGLAIGLALQGSLSHLAAGVMLLLFRPFRVGDAVKVSGETGVIAEIDFFFTRMDTFDNRRILIPNGKVFGNLIETITYHPRRRVDVAVGTSYDDDLDLDRSTLEAAVANLEGALEDPAPAVVLDLLGDSAILWRVSVWAPTPDVGAVKQRAIRAVKQALDAAGLSIPFPQVDVHLDKQEAAP